jgi:mannose-6-phosphate isomerase
MKLERRYVEKPWGRTELPPMFDPPAGKRIGEVWFTGAGEQPLLAKYLFTSERLSIQVHPNDEQARARGLKSGKSECWYILEAEPGATLGLGLKREVSADELRSAALDGSIEELIDWRPVRAGDFYMVPSDTIHAIGGGISLLEFQQNADVTYRLYDYGRPRELHLDDAIAVARRASYPGELAQHLAPSERRTLVDGPHFTLVHTDRDALQDRKRWIMPTEGEVRSGNDLVRAGDCLLVAAGERVEGDGRMLIGAKA